MTNQKPEVILLKHLLIYNNYKKYYKYISINKEYKELKILYHSLELLHKKFPETDKTVADLSTMVWASYPNMKGPEREAIEELLFCVSETMASNDVLDEVLETARKRGLARDLAIKALEVSEGYGDFKELEKISAELEVGRVVHEPTEIFNFVTHDLRTLKSHTIHAAGLNFRLKCLQRSLGPLRQGDFGFVFARPESGKTTFLASEVSYMAQQVPDDGGPILWFNNEEQGEKVQTRVMQAVLGYDQYQLNKNGDEDIIQAKYKELGGDRIQIIDEPVIYKWDVEAVLEVMKPSLVIFDQIDKIRGFDADRNDLVYGKIYQWARELAKRYCPVIGICQSDGQGEGVKWLTMSHVADAKTAKQAEADWILGIGKSNEVSTEDIRFFNISKNKLLGNDQTDPNERHGRYEVYIRPMIARYEDLE